MNTPTTLYDYYASKGQALPKTAQERFADPAFASSAKSAGYDVNNYHVNMDNASANNAILANLLKGGTTTPPVVTPPPAGTPTGTPTGTGNATASPYFSRYDKNITDIGAKIDATTGIAPDLATITQQKRDNADAMIKEIQAQFQRELQSENVAGGARNDRVRALNLAGGLGGSNFASSNAQVQEDKNQKVVDLMTAENSAKIQSILSGIDSRASEQYKSELATYRASLEGDLTRQKELKDTMRKQAMDAFSGLATAGVTLDQLKVNEPEAYKQLQDEFGGSDLEMKSAYNASLPANMQTQYTTHIIKGANGNAIIHRYGINPLTKTLDQSNNDTGQNYETFTNAGSDIKEIGGAIYRVAKDGSTLTKLENTIPKPSVVKTTVTKPAFTVTSPQKTKLLSAGFGTDDLTAIQNDFNKGATLDEVVKQLTGATPAQVQAFKDAFTVKSTSARGL